MLQQSTREGPVEAFLTTVAASVVVLVAEIAVRELLSRLGWRAALAR